MFEGCSALLSLVLSVDISNSPAVETAADTTNMGILNILKADAELKAVGAILNWYTEKYAII